MDSEKQKDEITALESIYTSEEFSYHEANDQYHCTLKIFISLPEGYFVTYRDTKNKDAPEEKITVSHLPPVVLLVTLPLDYPSKSPPEFTLCCSWLRYKLTEKLCKRLDELWVENRGLEILFTWVAFLQNETLEYLSIESHLDISDIYTSYKVTSERIQRQGNEASGEQIDKASKGVRNKIVQKRSYRKNRNKKFRDKRAISDRPVSKNPVHMLLDYNEKRLSIEFKRNFYTCKICFIDKAGESCTQFKPCLHVFCKECIGGYLEVRIKDGAVQNICCPEEKCTSEATPGQIKDLVSPELFAKYDSTLLNATLDTMLDIVYCPRRDCQYPVSKEANEKMASCPSCQYTFCIFCKMVYHGVEPCKFTSVDKQKLVNEYENASEMKKSELEGRYGKKQLQILIENTMSEIWINTNSHNCPNCNAAIEKSDGCNKMTCGRCNTYFCWICGSRLNQETPYSHFQDPKSKCYKMLYYGLIEDEDSDDDFEFPAVYLDYDSDDDDDFYDDDFVIDLDNI